MTKTPEQNENTRCLRETTAAHGATHSPDESPHAGLPLEGVCFNCKQAYIESDIPTHDCEPGEGPMEWWTTYGDDVEPWDNPKSRAFFTHMPQVVRCLHGHEQILRMGRQLCEECGSRL